MTQEFEEWAESCGNLAVLFNGIYNPQAKNAWQASREQLKAKMLSDEMVDKIAKALAIEAYHTFELEVLHNTNADDHAEKEFTHYISPAKAALEAIAREL